MRQKQLAKYDVNISFYCKTEEDIFDDLGYRYDNGSTCMPKCDVRFTW